MAHDSTKGYPGEGPLQCGQRGEKQKARGLFPVNWGVTERPRGMVASRNERPDVNWGVTTTPRSGGEGGQGRPQRKVNWGVTERKAAVRTASERGLGQQREVEWGVTEKSRGKRARSPVTVKLEKGAPATVKEGGTQRCEVSASAAKAVKKKKRVSGWRSICGEGGESAALPAQPDSMWHLVVQRSNAEDHKAAPGLVELQWLRQRRGERRERPEGATLIAGYGRTLADDYAIKSKAQATWKAYRAWYQVFTAFCDLFEVKVKALWGEKVEVLRVSCALMAEVYAVGTISIYATAVSCFMQMQGLKSPWENALFKATFEGIRRELGTAMKKQPGIEAAHIAAMCDIEGTPEGWSEMQWLQAKALILVGWQLFNRRQDFGRLQPCDLRFEKDVLEVLIRYAKNDLRGKTRAPQLAAGDDDSSCPLKCLKRYMTAAGIKVQAGCDKRWGEPFACSVCEPLFPSILTKAKGGKRPRAMPDSRVTKIVKDVMMTVAKVTKGEVLTLEEAKRFSAKSLRCGGCSEAAAQGVREGVTQGHGGWLSRTSLIHYDLMKKSEATLTSMSLSAAVQKLRQKGAAQPEQVAVAAAGLDRNPQLGTLVPDGEAESSDEDEKQWGVVKVTDVRRVRGSLEYQVLWEDTDHHTRDERTWEPEARLREDGMGHKIGGFWCSIKGRERKAQGLKSTSARAR